MAVVSLERLRARVRRKADMVDSDFVEDDDLDELINDAGRELYGLIFQHGGGANYALQQPIQIVAGTEAYDLTSPAKTIFAIEWKDEPVGSFGFVERNVRGGSKVRYRLEGPSAVRFMPPPAEDGPHGRVWYFPFWTEMAEDADSREVWDWEEFVVISAAIECLGKEESDTTRLERRKAWLQERIEQEARKRDSGINKIVDTGDYDRGANPWFGDEELDC